MITAKVLLITTLTEHYYHDGASAKNSEKAILGMGNGTPMILCVSHFIFGLLRRSQTYILSGFMSY
jgi:hypothetical protein